MNMRLHTLTCLAFLPATLLTGCQGCTEADQNLKKAVWIKYAHIANVTRFQPNNGNSMQYNGVNNGSFWAVFEICSIDVQGSALTGFNYNTGKFVITWDTAEIGKATPGLVARSDAQAFPSPGAEVDGVVRTAFETGPSAQYLPKQLYLKPGFRFAILLNSYPAGYQGQAMDLKYLGQPEVAAVVQNVQQDKPSEVPFYNHGISPVAGSYCP
jgi:hypothetical protein